MKFTRLLALTALLPLAAGCGEDTKERIIAAGPQLSVVSSITHQFSDNDNIESVRYIAGRELPSAVAVGSKSKFVYYLEDTGKTLREFEDHLIARFITDDDNEFTNSAFLNYKKDSTQTELTTLLTETVLKKENGKIVDCGGNLLIASTIRPNNPNKRMNFLYIPVGSMPDAVAISPDKKYAITADEHDSTDAWGKCPIASIMPSISIVSLGALNGSEMSVDNTKVVKQIQFIAKGSNGAPREPEYVAFASDNDTVAVTLQDSNEVAIFSLKDILAKSTDLMNETEVPIIVELAKNSAGASPWPDGIVSFDIGQKHYFAMAGEANDTITIIDDKGNPVSNPQITEKEVPSNYPCLKDEDFATVKYSPDSITSFTLNDRTYLAATLRYAGAVIIYDVTNPQAPVFELITKAGINDVVGTGTCNKNTSKVYPEGITSGVFGDAVYIWVANEGDNTVTSLKVTVK